jgi:hypothetical protein
VGRKVKRNKNESVKAEEERENDTQEEDLMK